LNVFGDCRQLPPIVQSVDPRARMRLGRDVFTACGVDQTDSVGVTMLKEQFRMHPTIRELVSNFAYEGQLRDAPGLAESRSAIATHGPLEGQAVAWYDLSGIGAIRFFDRSRRSRFNPISAVCSVRLALETSLRPVVLLTPYRTQARLLAALVNDAALIDVEVGTIHRYQGSEAAMVIVDLVDGSGPFVGTPLRGKDGERLLTVGLSRAQGKLIVVGNRTMPTGGLTSKALLALGAIRRIHRAAPSVPWDSGGFEEFRMEIRDGLQDSLPLPTELVAAFLPATMHPDLKSICGPHATRWQGHPSWLTKNGVFGICAVGPTRTQTIVLTKATRFAEAFADAVTGSPLTRRSVINAPPGSPPPQAVRHDRCERCDGEVVPDRATKHLVELACRRCNARRRASDREIGAWLRQVGPRCPSCRQAMRLISGRRAPYGPFLSCSTFPGCDTTLELEALCGAAVSPDPPPSPEPKPERRRRSSVLVTSILDRRTCPSCFLSKSAALFEPTSNVCRDCT